jgi:predicted dithiol-disulfide oxidoreductase (DUF899 family)
MSHRIVSREEWLRVRTALLEQEKALTRHAVVARAPIEEIEVVRKRMGWKLLWVSSFGCNFNYDFNVSFMQPPSQSFRPSVCRAHCRHVGGEAIELPLLAPSRRYPGTKRRPLPGGTRT